MVGTGGGAGGPGIGVKTSGGGHKMLETQSTSPTLHGGLVDHRGLILTPMQGPRVRPTNSATSQWRHNGTRRRAILLIWEVRAVKTKTENNACKSWLEWISAAPPSTTR